MLHLHSAATILLHNTTCTSVTVPLPPKYAAQSPSKLLDSPLSSPASAPPPPPQPPSPPPIARNFPAPLAHSHHPWNPLQSAVAAVLDSLEDLLLPSSSFPHPNPSTSSLALFQLSGNFLPVPECPASATSSPLPCDGTVPTDLNGVYVRNGANPAFPAAAHHLFDGDGMLHAVALSGGAATSYVNRYTLTHRLRQELLLGRPIFPKSIGELHGHTGVARLLLFLARQFFRLLDSSRGSGVANAGLVFFDGLLLAMSEDDLPYAVHLTPSSDIITLGRYDFRGQLTTSSSMIAHPKLDPRTGELFALSYDVIKRPYLKYFKFSPTGVKGPDVPVSVKEPTMVHDFAITEKHVVIPDQQVVFRLPEMLRGGSPVVHDLTKVPRFGVLPRDDHDQSRIVWVDVPGCFCLHLWNAWEEIVDDGQGGQAEQVVVIGSCMTPPDGMFNDSAEGSVRSILSEIRLDLKRRTAKVTPLVPEMNLEAGQVNRQRLGRKSRYAYLAIAEPWPKVSGIAKVDLLKGQGLGHDLGHTSSANPSEDSAKDSTCTTTFGTCVTCTSNSDPTTTTLSSRATSTSSSTSSGVVAQYMYPPQCFGGEPMFVPRAPEDASTPEDDGYILTFMHNEATDKSELLILDASSPSLKKLASIKLPSRVPYGFHGTFITSKELQHQKASC